MATNISEETEAEEEEVEWPSISGIHTNAYKLMGDDEVESLRVRIQKKANKTDIVVSVCY